MRGIATMNRRQHSAAGFSILGLLAIVILIGAVAIVALTYKRWEGQDPAVTFDRELKAVGRTPALQVKVEDAGTGLKHVRLTLKQKDQEIPLAEENFERSAAEHTRTYDVGALIGEK